MLRLALYINKSIPNLNLTGANPNDAIFINNNGGASCFGNFLNTNVSAQSCNIAWTQGSKWISNLKLELNTVFCTQANSLYPCICFTWDNANEKVDLENWLFSSSFNLRIIPKVVVASIPRYIIAFDIPFKGNSATLVNNSTRDYYLLETSVSNCINPNYLTELSEVGAFPCTNSFDGFTVSASDKTNGITNSLLFTAYNNDPFPTTPSECSDLRTSEDGQNIHFIISDGVSNISELDIPFLLSEGSTQEKSIKTYMNDTFYNSLINNWNSNYNVMARCYFNAGIVRSACTVRLVAKVYGESLAIEPSVTPPYVNLDNDVLLGRDVDILRASFSPCSDKPISIAEDLSAFLDGLRSGNDISLGFSFYQVIPYKVVIENCTALTNFCCDDESISDDDSIEIEKPTELIKIYGGNGGQGGDDVNIQCICDNLSNINSTLLAFKNANEAALSDINVTLSNINIDINNDCVCDNLSEIKDSIDLVKGSIDSKELSVVNNNTVQPPVNNVSVQSPINNITLPTTELANIATNTRALNCVCASLQNLEVIEQGTKESIDGVKLNLQCGKDDNISCILDNVNSNVSNIANSLVCGNDGIACVLQGKEISVDVDMNTTDIADGLDSITQKLDDINSSVHDGLFNSDDESNLKNISESLNTSDDDSKSLADVFSDSLNTSDDESMSLADVIKDKEMGTNIDVEVSPADDVNINRVYYTNQRNGETNI